MQALSPASQVNGSTSVKQSKTLNPSLSWSRRP
ncbi:hypothetical protein ACHAW6_000496 [Cyclotella cf. meneghiniana]